VAGTQVTFIGTGFGSTQGFGNVWLGSTYGVVASWSDTQVIATVASGAKSGTAQILQSGVWSAPVNFTVVTPVVNSVTPGSGMAGTQVTFIGTGFGATQGSGNVWLGSTYGIVVSWSDTQVVATVASGAKSGTAQILQGGVWSDPINFTVTTPRVTSVTPTTGMAGTQVTFTGTGFGATQGAGNVWLGSTYGVVVSWSDTQVIATVALGAKSGTAQILQGGVWSDPINFTVTTPKVTSVTPTSGMAGTQVTFTGTGFGSTQGTGNVWLGSTYGVVVSWSDTQVVATVASGAKSGTAQILQGGVWSDPINFAVTTPKVTSVTPTSGVAGTQVTFTGTGFGSAQGSGNVWLGSTYGVVVSWSDTQVVATVASGAKSGTAQILQGGVWSDPVNFTVVTPVVTSVTPTTGVAGTQVTFTGTGFGSTQGSGNVWLGSTYGMVVSWSDTQVVATIASGAKSGTAQILQGGVWSDPINFTVVTPAVSSVAPTIGVAGTQVTFTGTGFGSTQGSGNVWLGSTYGVVVSWSDTQVVATVASGSTSGTAQILQGGVWSDPVHFAVNSGPVLRLSVSDAPLQVNLTSPQTLDWIHWGRISATVPDRKDGITPLISDYTPVNGAQPFNSAGNIAFSWSDGNHPAAVSDSDSDVEAFAPASGFQITVPADTTAKTLNLYTEVFFGQGVLQASLSDGSVAAINDQSVIDADVASKVYSIDFRAASDGQTLTVTFTSTTPSLGVGLQAATLTQHLPVVVVTSPSPGQSFQSSYTVPLNASATQIDGSISDVLFNAGSGLLFDVTNAPFTASLTPPSSGHYSVTATATDGAGLSNTSAPIEFDVIGQGGTLSIEEDAVPSSPINLDAQGSADWILWGPINNTPGHILGRKSGVEPLISEYKPIGNHSINAVSFAHNLCFTGNQQNYCSGSELSVHGAGDGFEITVPADTTPRTLQLYVGAVAADGKVIAFLSDGSAPVASEVGISGPPAPPPSNTSLYNINYSAASSGQTLTVRFTLNTDQGGGEIDLIAAAVSGSPITPTVPAPQITSINPSSAPTNTQVTIAGSNFGATQNGGVVLFGQHTAQVVSWSDTAIVVTVPAEIRDGNTVQVVVFTPNGFSNSARFTVPSYKIYPASLSLLIGQSAKVTVKDSSGEIVTGLSWAASDSTIVDLSTDDPPLITGLAAGSVQVYAGDVPFPVTVYAGTVLPAGTPIWTLPVGGSGNVNVIPAFPSDSGADVFALDDSGTLTAVSSDGNPVWSIRNVPGGSSAAIIPDFAGTALLSTSHSYFDGQHFHSTHVVKQADPITGLTDLYVFAEQPAGQGDFSDASATHAVIPHPSGPVFIQDNDSVTVLDPSTRLPITVLTLQRSTLTLQTPEGTGNSTSPPKFGKMIIAGDSKAYLPYVYTVETDTQNADNTGSSQVVTHSMVLRISPDGSNANTELKNWTFNSTCSPFTDSNGVTGTVCSTSGPTPSVTYQSVITNADNGAAVFNTTVLVHCSQEFFGVNMTNTGCPTDAQAHVELSYVAQDAVTSQVEDAVVLPNNSSRVEAFVPVLQREDRSYIGTDTTSEIFGYSNLIGVGATGGLLFKQPLSTTPTVLTPLYATSDGGMVVRSRQVQNCQTNPDQCDTVGTPALFTADPNGNVTAQSPDKGIIYSWKGAYSTVGDPTLESFDDAARPPLAVTFAATSGGNLAGNLVAMQHHSFGLFWCGTAYLETGSCQPNGDDIHWGYVADPTPDNNGILEQQDFSRAHRDWVSIIEAEAFKAFQKAYVKYAIIVSLGTRHGTFDRTLERDQEYSVEVMGGWDPDKVAGRTFTSSKLSKVYYPSVLGGAEEALGHPEFPERPFGNVINFTPDYPPTTPKGLADFVALMRALGTGLGTASAHEIGHELEVYFPNGGPGFPYMDCGDYPKRPGGQIDCENLDNFVYNFFNSDGTPQNPSNPEGSIGGQFFYIDVPGQHAIHWSLSNDCWLQMYGIPGKWDSLQACINAKGKK